MQGAGRGHVAGRPVGAGEEAARCEGVGGVGALYPLVVVYRPAGGRDRLLIVAVALHEPGRCKQDAGRIGGVLVWADVAGEGKNMRE